MIGTMPIDAELLSVLDDLSLVARDVVEGFLSGQHRSPFLGYSTEFSSYRPYLQGDDLRHVDWKLWGRTDQLYVKQFEDDTNLCCQILLDTSASMNFGSVNKFDYARALAASLACLMVRQHDAPGLILFGDRALEALPARGGRRHLDDLFLLLATTQARGRTILSQDLWNVIDTIHRRGLAIVISDFLSAEAPIADLLKQLHFQRQEALLFHLLAPEEIDFVFEGEFLMEDSETGQEISVHAGAFRKEYHKRLHDFCERVRQAGESCRADYCRIRTDAPLAQALGAYLETRTAA